MARRSKTSYTFAVTLPDVEGLNIPTIRQFLKDALACEQNARNPDDPIKDVDLSNVRIHLTNKEVKYG